MILYTEHTSEEFGRFCHYEGEAQHSLAMEIYCYSFTITCRTVLPSHSRSFHQNIL